jgi:hypothetical protein
VKREGGALAGTQGQGQGGAAGVGSTAGVGVKAPTGVQGLVMQVCQPTYVFFLKPASTAESTHWQPEAGSGSTSVLGPESSVLSMVRLHRTSMRTECTLEKTPTPPWTLP